MILRNLRRELVALMTALALVASGIPVASATTSRAGAPRASRVPQEVTQVLQEVNGVNVEEARAILVKASLNKNEKVAQRAKHLLDILDILTATDPAERHERIRRLPVVVTDSPTTDGREGIVRSFEAGGKTRVRLFIPATSTRETLSAVEEADSSGPFAPVLEHADAPADECYDGPEPCSSWEEMDDLGIVLAMSIADVEAAQDDFDDWCGSYPEQCGVEGGDGIPAVVSGPSAIDCEDCVDEAAAAIITLGASASAAIFAYLGYEAAVLSGLTLTTAGLAAMLSAAFLVSFTAGFAVGYWVGCVLALPAGLGVVSPFRPEAAYR